jgi:cytochrome d ubiquinol oxidase subunit II
LKLAPAPVIGLAGMTILTLGLRAKSHTWPFAGAALVFLSGYLGLAADFFPYIVPYSTTFREAASAPNALALILGGVVILLPAILSYTVFVYWLFRGKVSADAGYH